MKNEFFYSLCSKIRSSFIESFILCDSNLMTTTYPMRCQTYSKNKIKSHVKHELNLYELYAKTNIFNLYTQYACLGFPNILFAHISIC